MACLNAIMLRRNEVNKQIVSRHKNAASNQHTLVRGLQIAQHRNLIETRPGTTPGSWRLHIRPKPFVSDNRAASTASTSIVKALALVGSTGITNALALAGPQLVHPATGELHNGIDGKAFAIGGGISVNGGSGSAVIPKPSLPLSFEN